MQVNRYHININRITYIISVITLEKEKCCTEGKTE